MYSYQRTFSIAGAVALAGMLAGCAGDQQSESAVESSGAGLEASVSISGDSADALDVALLRVVNAAPGVASMSIRADSVSMLPNVSYKAASAYERLPDGWRQMEASDGATNQWGILDANNEMLVAGHRYSMFVLPGEDGTGYDTRIVRDDVPEDREHALVRVVHAAKGVDEVTLFAGAREDALVDDVGMADDSDYESVDPFSGNLEIRTDDGRVLATLNAVQLSGGSAYTIVLTTSRTGSAEAFWIRDALVP